MYLLAAPCQLPSGYTSYGEPHETTHSFSYIPKEGVQNIEVIETSEFTKFGEERPYSLRMLFLIDITMDWNKDLSNKSLARRGIRPTVVMFNLVCDIRVNLWMAVRRDRTQSESDQTHPILPQFVSEVRARFFDVSLVSQFLLL